MRVVTHQSAGLRAALIWALVIFLHGLTGSTVSTAAPFGRLVQCRVIEAESSAKFHVRLAIFHYRDEADRALLGAMLRKYDGASVQFQSGDGTWQNATVLRLRTCFGRGLLIFSDSAPPLAAKREIIIRFPSAPGK